MKRPAGMPRGAASRVAGRALPAVLWMALIFAFSAQPDLPRAPLALLDLILKKVAHMTEYAVLAMLLWRALGPACDARWGNRMWVAWLLAVLYAVTDELHQSLVPGRTPAATDVLIDAAGAAIGLAVTAAILMRQGAGRKTAHGAT